MGLDEKCDWKGEYFFNLFMIKKFCCLRIVEDEWKCDVCYCVYFVVVDWICWVVSVVVVVVRENVVFDLLVLWFMSVYYCYEFVVFIWLC